MLSQQRYLAIVRASALYDLVATAGFATPWTFGLIVALAGALHQTLGWPGAVVTPDVWTTLFANLMGSVVIIWSIVRLRLKLPVLGRYDMVARFMFAAWQIVALMNGASWLLLVFLGMEIVFGVLQALPYGQRR